MIGRIINFDRGLVKYFNIKNENPKYKEQYKISKYDKVENFAVKVSNKKGSLTQNNKIISKPNPYKNPEKK